MASQNFTSGTVVTNAWFVDANTLIWGVFNGASTAALARTAIGLGTMAVVNSPVPVANGGTASTTAVAALSALGAAASGLVTASGLTQSTAKLLGRTTASTGAVEEISVTGSLSLSAGTLSSSAGITIGTAIAGNGQTTLTFSGIPTTTQIKRVTLNLIDVSTSGTSPLVVRIGAATLIATGYVSQWGTRSAEGSNTTGILLHNAANAAAKYNGTITFSLITTDTWVASGIITDSTNTVSPSFFAGSLTGGFSGGIQRIAITTTGGTDTFDNGSSIINVSYET